VTKFEYLDSRLVASRRRCDLRKRRRAPGCAADTRPEFHARPPKSPGQRIKRKWLPGRSRPERFTGPRCPLPARSGCSVALRDLRMAGPSRGPAQSSRHAVSSTSASFPRRMRRSTRRRWVRGRR